MRDNINKQIQEFGTQRHRYHTPAYRRHERRSYDDYDKGYE